jgi:hypothetical protein
VHQQDAANSFFLFFGRVVNFGVFGELAGVHTDVGHLAVLVGDDLECKRTHWLFFVRVTEQLVAGLRVGSCSWRKVKRRWQEVNNGVKHWLNALVLVCRATQHWDEFEGNGSLTNCVLDFVFANSFASEVLLHECLV